MLTGNQGDHHEKQNRNFTCGSDCVGAFDVGGLRRLRSPGRRCFYKDQSPDQAGQREDGGEFVPDFKFIGHAAHVPGGCAVAQWSSLMVPAPAL